MDIFIPVLLSAVPDGRLFGLDMQTFYSILIQLFNAAVLAVLLSFILYKPLSNFLRKRSEGIRAQLNKAEEDMSKADELKAQYEKKLQNIEAERAEVLESARLLAAEKSRQMLADARKESDSLWERARADIEKERERAKEAMKQHIIDISSVMAEKIVVHTIDYYTQERLFSEALAELEDASWPGV